MEGPLTTVAGLFRGPVDSIDEVDDPKADTASHKAEEALPQPSRDSSPAITYERQASGTVQVEVGPVREYG